MILQAVSTVTVGPARRATPTAVPGGAQAVEYQSAPASPAPPASSSPQFSTDMRIDDQHQVYYEFVDASTGDVLFEIPPEALRAIGESLNLPLNGDSGGHGFDVKS